MIFAHSGTRVIDFNVKYLNSEVFEGYISIALGTSVADPDPYVFRPPGSRSGSVSQSYGSGSGSFQSSSKNSKKNLDACCFVTAL
jgi:hypothetical protein